MNIKVKEVTELYKAMEEVSGIRLPIKTALKVGSILNDMKSKVDIIAGQEKKILDGYDVEIKDQNIVLKNPEQGDKLAADLNELYNSEIELEYETVEIDTDSLNDAVVSPAVLNTVSKFIKFV